MDSWPKSALIPHGGVDFYALTPGRLLLMQTNLALSAAAFLAH